MGELEAYLVQISGLFGHIENEILTDNYKGFDTSIREFGNLIKQLANFNLTENELPVIKGAFLSIRKLSYRAWNVAIGLYEKNKKKESVESM